ncbi:hypothetical protein DS031_05130 [Bacillus taeanensis]|uniref:Spore cortex protein CoxA n=2 Tax=Bacillus taeanensis TaxID=273032 RepID=A0A366XXN9_9BACI|nr:hypothetical protein DS031_05130 [Bacillus taeanensis]
MPPLAILKMKGGFKMKKIAWTLSATMLIGGLTACNMNDNNEAMDYNDNVRPIGYYSNDNGNNRPLGVNYNNRNVGMGNLDNTAEGPLTDMVDQDDNYHYRNDPRNYNRRGVMDRPNDRPRNVGYYDGTDNELAERIADKVEKLNNIKDVNTLVYGNRVVIAVDTNDQNDQDVEASVRKAVNSIVQGRNVTVVTDEDLFGRIDNINNDMRDGRDFNEVQPEINNIFNDLGDTMKRPFQDNS